MTDSYEWSKWQIVEVHYAGTKKQYRVVKYSDKSVVIFEKTFVKEDQAKQFLKKSRDESL